MKTYLTYGFAMALAGALLSLLLFFLGYHNDPTKLAAAQWIGGIGGLAISIICLILGMKARRAEIPASEGFSYGRGFLTGFLISVFAGLFGIVTNYLYYHVVNPGFNEMVHQVQVEKMQERGMSADQIERMEKFSSTFSNPLIQACAGLVAAIIFGTILSLIIAAFLKREPSEDALVPQEG